MGDSLASGPRLWYGHITSKAGGGGTRLLRSPLQVDLTSWKGEKTSDME